MPHDTHEASGFRGVYSLREFLMASKLLDVTLSFSSLYSSDTCVSPVQTLIWVMTHVWAQTHMSVWVQAHVWVQVQASRLVYVFRFVCEPGSRETPDSHEFSCSCESIYTRTYIIYTVCVQRFQYVSPAPVQVSNVSPDFCMSLHSHIWVMFHIRKHSSMSKLMCESIGS